MNDKIKSEPTSVWHNASEEPDNIKNIVIWAEGFSNLIAVEEYRPKEKKFYYESGDHYYNVDITRKGLIWAYVDELLNLAMQEEPVSEDFNKALEDKIRKAQGWTYIEEMGCECPMYQEFGAYDLEKFAKWAANWQKQQFKKNRLKHCNSITNEQAELEQGFIDQHFDKYQRIPTYLDAIEYGMRLQKEQLMAKAEHG